MIALALTSANLLPLKEPLNIHDVEKIIIAYNLKGFDLNNENKLYTNIHNDIDLVNIANQIIFTQDNLFTVKSNPYTILLIDNPKLDRGRGVAEENYVIVEGSVRKDIKNYVKVVSHELMHRYIGHIVKQDQENEVPYKWFFEGFTEFYGVKTLYNMKYINESEYLETINAILQGYFNSLICDINFDKLNTKHLRDSGINRLNYDKGFILALILDDKIKKVSNDKYNLQNLMDEIISDSALKQLNFNTDLLIRYLRLRYHLSESFTKKYIAAISNSDMLLISLPNKMLNKDLIFQDTNTYGDICFDFTKSIESGKIFGVKQDSDCYNMGLRDGQELKCYSIYLHTGNFELKVLEKGIAKNITFKANKVARSIPVYK